LIQHNTENDASNSYIVARVFIVAVTFLPSCCPAMIVGYTYRHTDRLEGFMNYAVEMGSGAMTYIAIFIKIGSAI
jgi:hypothetical protein